MAPAPNATAQEKDDQPPIVFVSYSHKDEAWKNKLQPHLQALQVAGRVEVWDDRRIDGGALWYNEITENMGRAGVAICLISPAFLASEFCIKEEVAYFLRERESRGMVIIPVLIRPCHWELHDWISITQMIPRDEKSLDLDFPNDAAQHNELVAVSKTIVKILDDPAYKVPPPPAPAFPPLPAERIDIGRLPETGDELFGRRAEIEMLDEAWASDQINIVALKAWGGVGKSTLVKRWTERLAKDNFRAARGVFAWSFYSQGSKDRTTSADVFINEALRFFGDQDPSAGSPWAKGERLAELVGSEKALLLLDGMEPLQDAYQGIKDPALARLIECLAGRNAGLCVITTRETVKELDDFKPHVIEKDLEQISAEAGRALLRVKGVQGDDAALEQASRAFGNHALAINLLASYLTRFAEGDIAKAGAIPELAEIEEKDGRHPRRVMAAFAERFGEGPEVDLLHVMGLFDRPADGKCIAALRKSPAIPGLTDHLVRAEDGLLAKWWRRATGGAEAPSLDDVWDKLLAYLCGLGLLAKASHHAPDELDAHPLVREHFGAQLRDKNEEAWQAGHLRLYEHLKKVPKKHQPDTLAEMAPLFQAVHHGCHAGRRQEVYDEIYRDRITRKDDFYLIKMLGAVGASLGLLASFFDPPFERPATDLADGSCTDLLHEAAFLLRALGRLGEAVAPQRESMEIDLERGQWGNAARSGSNLSELQLTLGNVSAAVASGERAVKHADMSSDGFMREISRSVLADARHQAGKVAAAYKLFKDTETMQAKRQASIPWLYSLQGYRY